MSNEDTGEMFKEAYRQEAIQDQVRAVEFEDAVGRRRGLGVERGGLSEEQDGKSDAGRTAHGERSANAEKRTPAPGHRVASLGWRR